MKLILVLSLIIALISADHLPLPINNANEKIIGGLDVGNTASSPFVAAIYHAGPGFLCAGVIINLNWILTTAECVYAYSFENPIQVYAEVGGVMLNTVEAGKETVLLNRIIIHPAFHSKEMIYYNNLALLKTMYAMTQTTHVAPIALPSTIAIPPGTMASLIGWGGSSSSFPVTNLQLHSTNVVLDEKECQRISGMVIEGEFCTDPKVSASACKYDHGSPLYRYDAILGSVLLGVVNYAPCTTINYPTVYTNIPDYVNWILTNAV